jgi:hypothetical protein
MWNLFFIDSQFLHTNVMYIKTHMNHIQRGWMIFIGNFLWYFPIRSRKCLRFFLWAWTNVCKCENVEKKSNETENLTNVYEYYMWPFFMEFVKATWIPLHIMEHVGLQAVGSPKIFE